MPLLTASFSPVTVAQVRLLGSDKNFLRGSQKTKNAVIAHTAYCLGANEMEIAMIMSAEAEDIDRYGRPRA